MDELVETIVPGGWGLALGVGIGVALLATRGWRPLAKQAVKGYLRASDQVQKATAGARSGLQDIYSEARAERQHETAFQPPEAGSQV